MPRADAVTTDAVTTDAGVIAGHVPAEDIAPGAGAEDVAVAVARLVETARVLRRDAADDAALADRLEEREQETVEFLTETAATVGALLARAGRYRLPRGDPRVADWQGRGRWFPLVQPDDLRAAPRARQLWVRDDGRLGVPHLVVQTLDLPLDLVARVRTTLSWRARVVVGGVAGGAFLALLHLALGVWPDPISHSVATLVVGLGPLLGAVGLGSAVRDLVKRQYDADVEDWTPADPQFPPSTVLAALSEARAHAAAALQRALDATDARRIEGRR